jgi:hypothetical protein
MLPDPMTIPDDLIALANDAVNAHLAYSAAAAAFTDAGIAVNTTRDARSQKLADLRNGLTAAGLDVPAFRHNGFQFTVDGAELKVTTVPPTLEDLGNEP